MSNMEKKRRHRNVGNRALLSRNKSRRPSICDLEKFSKLHILSYLPANDLRHISSTNSTFMSLSRSLGLWINHCSRRWAPLQHILRRHPESQISFKDMLLIPSAPYTREQRVYLSMFKYHCVKDLKIRRDNYHRHQSMVSPNMSILHKMSAAYPSGIDKKYFVPMKTRKERKNVREFRSFRFKVSTKGFSSQNVNVLQFCASAKESWNVCQANRPFPRAPTPTVSRMWALLNPVESILGEPAMPKPFCAPIVTMREEDKSEFGPVKVEIDVTPTLLSYFEVSILPRDQSQEPKELPGQSVPKARSVIPSPMTIGLARKIENYDEKWTKDAFGYDGAKGTIFYMTSKTKRATADAPKYSVGDTVGCGLDYASGSMFFTLNGTFIQAFLGVDLFQHYFATVDTMSDNPFHVNFGMFPFLFDICPFRKRRNPLIERSLPNSNDNSEPDAVSIKGIQKYIAGLGPSFTCNHLLPDVY